MTLIEIIRYYRLNTPSFYRPYVVKILPGTRTTADWWAVTFGAGYDLDSDKQVNISAMLQLPNTQYNRVRTLGDLLKQRKSFYFDAANQALYVHLLPLTIPAESSFSSGVVSGVSDKDFCYVSGQVFKPLIKQAPPLGNQIDLAKYDALAFSGGLLELDNTDGEYDDVITDDIYGNDVFYYYLHENNHVLLSDYQRSDLLAMASYYVEDIGFSLESLSIGLQDKRKSRNADILTQFNSEDEPIPLVYGTVAALPAEVLDDEFSPVIYQFPAPLQGYGNIMLKANDDKTWFACPPGDILNIDLELGTVEISHLQARENSSPTGSARKCYIKNAQGIPNASALDVIVDLNRRVLGLEYIESNYDIEAWELNKPRLAPIAVVFSEQMKLFEAYQAIQQSVNRGFRLEVGPDGRYTCLMDDRQAPIIHSIQPHEIVDNLTLTVTSDSSLLAAIVRVHYNHNSVEDTWETYSDDSNYLPALEAYHQAPTLEIETMLTNEADAIERAEFMLRRFAKIPMIAEFTVYGDKYFTLRIFDMINVALFVESYTAATPDLIRRRYFGKWDIQVIGLDFKIDTLETTIRGALVRQTEA